MNSVQGEISGKTIANEIRLERASHIGSFLLVEGGDDVNLFKKFVDSSECSIIVCAGKINVIEAISILAQYEFRGSLGILDKDFFDIVGYPDILETVLFTDHNDVEIMVMCSAALDHVLLEFGNDDKKQALEESAGQSICNIIFDASAFLGALRLLSAREEWNLRFEGMTYRFRDANSFELDELRTVQQITGRSDDRPPVSDQELASLATKEKNVRNVRHEICCGHDCVRLLGRALRQRLGNTSLFNNSDGAKNLAKTLRIAYDWDQFSKTRLYHDIRAWEASAGYSVLRT